MVRAVQMLTQGGIMKHRKMLWAGHLFALILLADGVRWLAGNIRGLSDLNLLLALAAMTGLVLNHLRWWFLERQIDDRNALAKFDPLIVANYCILILVLQLFHFRT
jgi:hypothetical protein